ncbi:unnamed protein product [Rhizoctonia solani]|uniref:Uncharacterized protein n=1 Tax=Rhizoctonia solani TaxID=456999 RepID=A0A8H3GQC4_9AGAM|nr:unnamed protein product [Rhizoctonia solani]
MVWSSAQPHSVHSMLDSFFGHDRNRLVGIWARDTLGLPSEHYAQKVQTIKDLNTIWNAPAGLPPPVKIMPPPPMAILTDDPTSISGYDPTKPPPEPKAMIYNSLQLMPESTQENPQADRTRYFEIPEVKKDDPIPGLSTIDPEAGSTASVLPSGLYSALNSLLLDDSALKAHLQPYNHLTLPEYTADLRTRDVKRRDAVDALARDELVTMEDNVDVDDKNEESSDMMGKDGEDSKRKDIGNQRKWSTKRSGMYKHLRAAPYDKSLLAVIGVLDTVQYESSLVGWMKAGGMRPSEEEMNRVAALFLEEDKDQPSVSQEGEGDGTEDDGNSHALSPTIPTKRLSDSLVNTEQSSRKRHRSDLPDENSSIESSAELADDSNPDRTSGSSINNAAGPQPTKRKRHRVRQKPIYPLDHPLSANDPYPFFTDGKPEMKLWFQDRDTYTYWVRRGLLALKDCGIEPQAGVDEAI